MQSLLARQQAFQQASQADKVEKIVDKGAVKASRDQLKVIFTASTDESRFAWNLVDQLSQAGYLNPKVVDRLRRNFASNPKTAGKTQSKSAV